jgi:hypothetical protein
MPRPEQGGRDQTDECAETRDDRGPSPSLRATTATMIVAEITAAIRTRRHGYEARPSRFPVLVDRQGKIGVGSAAGWRERNDSGR